MSRILVTGGAGYIGVELCKQLIEKGHEIVIVDPCFFGEKPLQALNGKYTLIKGDVREPQKEWFKGVEHVCHLGGFSNDPMAAFSPKANMEINHEGTIKIAKLAKESGVKKFTFASSASIYDKGLTGEDDVMYTEESDVSPYHTFYYSISKIKAENDLKQLASKDFAVYCLRQGTVYGWNERTRFDLVVNTMVKTAICEGKLKVYHGGVMWRPLVDVTDVARAHIACLDKHNPTANSFYQIYNIVQDNYRILDLAHLIKHELEQEGIHTEIEVLYSNEPQRSYRMSGKKIEKELGFKPTIDVPTSVKKLIKEIKDRKMNNVVELNNPIYYNINWMKHLIEVKSILANVKRIL